MQAVTENGAGTETVAETSLIQVAEGVYQIAQSEPHQAGRTVLVFTPGSQAGKTASMLSEAIWPATDLHVQDFTELGGDIVGTAFWPMSEGDPRHLISRFGLELLGEK